MDALREGIQLRAQGQKDPLVEYKNEAYKLFVDLMEAIKQEALQNLFRSATNLEEFLKQLHGSPQQHHSAESASGGGAVEGKSGGGGSKLKLNLPNRNPSFTVETVGRNAPCPCGSGKKFKNCCGRQA